MAILLSAETTIDLPKELLNLYKISTIPYHLVMGENDYLDGEVNGDDLFAYTEKSGKLARTAAVNQAQFTEYFKELTKNGDEVIHITLSSEMSSSYSSAVIAASSFNGLVHVIDSRVLSTGIALLAIYARKLIDAGYNAEEIVSLVKERIPFVQTSFALESLNYLYKGGRCSALKMFGANLLGIKPRIVVDNGAMKASKVFRGTMQRWTKLYVEATLADFPNYDHDTVFITYSSCEDETIIDWIKNRLSEAGFKTIHVTRANGTVCCHCGPHCLGILYINDGDHPVSVKE